MKKLRLLITVKAVALCLPIFAQTVSQVVYDMVGTPYRSGAYVAPWGKHEAALHGVPLNYDWADGVIPGEWMNHALYGAMSTWGQVIEEASESPVTNVRVHIRNFKTYAYSGGQWILIESMDIDGFECTWWDESFVGAVAPAGANYIAEIGGGFSFTVHDNTLAHFWSTPWPRHTFPSNTQAIYTTSEMRLIPNTDPNVNLANVKYLGCVGNDYYATTTTTGAGPFESVAIPRHKFITSNWNTFTMYVSGSIPTSVSSYANEINSRLLPPGVTQDGPALSVNEIINDENVCKLTLYPNPTNTEFLIIGNVSANEPYQICSADGKIAQTGIVIGNSIKVDNLPTGLYLLKLKTCNVEKGQRFLKQ